MLGIWDFAWNSLFQGGSIVGPDGKFHLYVYVFMYNYVCVFIHRLACTINFSGLTINSTILFHFSRHPHCYFTFFSPSVFITLHLFSVEPPHTPHFPHQTICWILFIYTCPWKDWPWFFFFIYCCVSLSSFGHEIITDLLKEHCRASDMARWIKVLLPIVMIGDQSSALKR